MVRRMKLEWRILSFPVDPTGYRAATDTEGVVRMTVDGNEFVVLEEILILEFAAYANDWLHDAGGGSDRDFYYASMDEEEEPLLALVATQQGHYMPNSCWRKSASRAVRREEIVKAFSDFLAELRLELAATHNCDLEDVFKGFSFKK